MKRKSHKNINEQIERIKNMMFLMEQSCSIPDCLEKLENDGYTVLSSRDRASKRMSCDSKPSISEIVTILETDLGIPSSKINVRWGPEVGCFVLAQSNTKLGGYNRINLSVFEDRKFVLSRLLDNNIKIAYTGDLDVDGKRFIDFKYKGKVKSSGDIQTGLPFVVKDGSGTVKKVESGSNDIVKSGLTDGEDLLSNQVIQYDSQIMIPSHGALSNGETKKAIDQIIRY